MTPDVLLRPWRANDLAALLDAVRTGPDLPRQLDLPASPSDDEVAARLTGHLAVRTPQDHRFAVVLDGVAVGNVAVTDVEHTHGTGWVSYWLAPAARGRRLATRAAASVASWAFTELGLHRLELGHRTNNPASCRVATGAGFLAEGVQRARLRYGDVRYDVETHARLADDPSPDVPAVRVDPAG